MPRPRYLLEIALPVAAICGIPLVVLPYDFRQAESTRHRHRAALSLVVITGFVGQVSVVQLSGEGVTAS
jgi:branched-chain amino acid transport system permease protein